MNEPVVRIAPLQGELTLGDILAFVHRYWILVGVLTTLAVALAAIYLLFAKPKYTAVAQILIETSSSPSPTQLASESLITLDTPQIESQIALLRSEQISGKVANLLAAYRKGATNSDAPKSTGETGTSLWDRLSSLFGRSESAVEDEVQGNSGLKKKNGQITEIENGMDVRRVGLSYALDVSFQSTDPKTAAFVANAIGNTYVQDSLATRAEDARRSGVWLEGRIEELRHLMNEAAIAVQEFKARRDYRIYDTGKGDQNALRKEFEDPLVDPRNSNSQSVEPGKPGSASTSADTSSSAELTSLEELESKAQTYRKLYESYLQAYTDTIPKQSFPGTNARVITEASIPTQKSSPKRLFTLVVATFLGGFFGLGLALVHSVLDSSVHSASQISRNLGLPVLGELNNSLARRAYVPNWLRKLRRARGHRSASDFSMVRDNANSPRAREMMAAALSIKDTARSHGIKIVGLLGISPDQNGTLLSCNVAVACAQVGARTLLVELNENRRSALSVLVPEAGEGGGLDSTPEAVPLEPLLQLLHTSRANPDIAWTREEVGAIRNHLETLSDQFDLIFVDMPPPKSSVIYPCAFAVDGVVLVASADRSQASEVSETAFFLRGMGKQILGVVISRLA